MGYGEVTYGKEQMETSTNLSAEACWQNEDTPYVVQMTLFQEWLWDPVSFIKWMPFYQVEWGGGVFPKMPAKEEPVNLLKLFIQPDTQVSLINSDFWHIQSSIN